MRIIIAGGRDFNNYELLEDRVTRIIGQLILDNEELNPYVEIVSGAAKGADKLGEKHAKENDLPVKKFPADWNRYGKSAGYKRNEQMAKYAAEDNGVLIAFWDGKSKGTNHMIDLAKKYKLKVFVINY